MLLGGRNQEHGLGGAKSRIVKVELAVVVVVVVLVVVVGIVAQGLAIRLKGMIKLENL